MESIETEETREIVEVWGAQEKNIDPSSEEHDFEDNTLQIESDVTLDIFPGHGLSKVFKKHVYAVHSASNLGLVAKKIFNCLLYHTHSKLKEKSRFSVPTKELIRAIAFNSRDYEVLRDALEQLNTTAVQWNILGETSSKKTLEWRTSTILAAASLSDGACTFEFSSYMREHLSSPDVYVLLDLDELAKFKSSYGISLYENCIRFLRIKHTDYIPLKTFRYLMGITDDKKYLTYKALKQFVLSPALKEVNKIASFNVSLKEKRLGRKIVSLKFVMENKISENEKIISGNLQLKELMVTLEKLGVSKKKSNELISKFEPDYITNNINFVLSSRSCRAKTITSMGAYIASAVEENYAKSTLESLKNTEMKKAEIIENTADLNSIKAAYKDHLDSVTDEYILSLNDEEYERLKYGFEEYLNEEGGLTLEWFKKSAFNKVQIKTLFKEFVRKNQKIEKITSYEDFVLSKMAKS